METVQSKDYNTSFGISSFVLHVSAMAFMLCDHLWGTFLMHHEWLGYIGRLAFPIFAFMLVEGFFMTGDRKKYALRMFVFAVISEIPFNLMMSRRIFDPIHQNVLWTFLISLAMMSLFEKIRQSKRAWLKILLYPAVAMLFYIIGMITFVDYHGSGIIMVALFYFTRTTSQTHFAKKLLAMVIQLIAMYWINAEMLAGLVITADIFGLSFEMHKQSLALLSLPLIWLYNGEHGPYNKCIRYIYYLFYPVHILILGLAITLLY